MSGDERCDVTNIPGKELELENEKLRDEIEKKKFSIPN